MKSCIIVCLLALAAVGVVGCAQPEYNPTPTKSESDSLIEIIQLTDGFERAGEAYFSRDMKWIVFQAFPKGEDQYQMFVAPLLYDTVDKSPAPGQVRYATPLPNLKIPVPNDIVRAGEPIRITPPLSRNTCGYFSPDGNSVIFGSTAGKDHPDEPSSGYQRQGGTYRWSFPAGMEIFRADGWRQAVEAAGPGKIVDLAKHALTNNDGYDAEGSYSPDGRWIIFTSKVNDDMEICAMRADGSGFVQLTHEKGYDGGPFFSPDGKRIVYRSDRKANDLLQVFVADVVYDHVGNITGIRNEQQLNHDGNVNWGPYWHPDGKHIIYATSLHGHHNYELYLMRDDGKRKTRITFSDGADLLPTFSSNGKYLMWTSKRSKDKTTQVFLAKFKFPKGS